MKVDEFTKKWKPFPAIQSSNINEMAEYNKKFIEDLDSLLKAEYKQEIMRRHEYLSEYFDRDISQAETISLEMERISSSSTSFRAYEEFKNRENK